MADPPNKYEVVRVDKSGENPPAVPQPPTPDVTQVQVIEDPNTGQQIQVIYDANSKQYIPVQSAPINVPMPEPPESEKQEQFLGKNAIGSHKKRRMRVVEVGGQRTVEIEEDIEEVTKRTVSDETHLKLNGIGDVPEAMSKKRLLIGGALAFLVLMILADIVGVPHVRTSPGAYASLEGTKQIANADAPMIILKRLDRSVFLYTLDGIGWVFNALGGGGDEPGNTET